MFIFPPKVQAKILAGTYEVMRRDGTTPIAVARDSITKKITAHAIGTHLDPLTVAPQMLMGAGQLYQGHKALQGIKALSASVATLQATTAVIGVGVVGVAALSAVNLWQTLKLRKEVRQMRVEVREGFIDLKQVFADQGAELIEHIQHVSEDVEFRDHRTILARAYGLFNQAINRLSSAVTMQDFSLRSNEIDAVRTMLFQALSDYSNSQLMSDIGSVAYIRRRECVWAIEQAIAMTYELQGEWQTASDRLTSLDTTIRQDALITLDKTETVDELDFLFPELTRIHDHDLVFIEAWKDHIEWSKELSAEEIKQLQALAENESTENQNTHTTEKCTGEKPAEYSFYDKAKSDFVPAALHESLIYSFDEKSRRQGEDYIAERAMLEALSALNPQNLRKASPLTIANLNLYFAAKDESLIEEAQENAAVAAVA
ncbi:MAG: hypothetical protein AAFV85_02265 [Cyanobacteria bacterium J06634_6]